MKKILIGSALAIALGSGAFAAMGGISWLDATGLRGETRLLRTRIDGYWTARMDGDLERMAAYVHPLQGTIPEPGMLITEAYEVHDVAVDGEAATAQMTIKSRLKHPVLSSRERTVEMESNWVKHEGKWYLALAPGTVYEAIQAYQGKWTPPTAKAPSTAVDNTTTSVQ